MELKEFVKKCGSRKAAVEAIGCHPQSLNGWLVNRHSPRGMSRMRLLDLGIELPAP